MATNIGRVEFIASLDGSRLPAQARKLGREMEAAGAQSGKQFGENFGTEFEKSLTDIGKRASAAMERNGELVAENFGDGIERKLKARKAGIQSALQDMLIDRDALEKSFLSFDSGADALNHYGRELGFLGEDAKMFDVTLLETLETTEAMRESMKESEAETKRLAAAQQDLNDKIDRMNSLSRDTEAVRKASIRDGISYSQTLANMREEMVGLNAANQVSNRELERFSDNLERTAEDIRKQDAAAAKAAADKIARDEKVAASAEETSKRQRLASFKAQAAFDAAIEREEEAQRKAQEGHEKHFNAIQKISSAWRRMDGTVKLVIVSIVAAADEVAVLGSALGGGVVALGGVLSSVGVGALGLIGIFSQLNDEIDDLPTNLRPAAKDLKALGETFNTVGEAIAGAAVANSGAAFARLDDNIRDLIPSFELVGAMLGNLISQFSLSTQEGSAGFKEINKAVKLAVPNFESLATTAGQFGVALLRGINRAQPLVQDLLGWVDKLVNRFDDFTKGPGFSDWVGDAQRVFGSLGGLIDALGRSLNDLASPEAVGRTVDFLDNLTSFTPHLETLLDTMGELDAFGLLAEALAKFSEALAPAAEPAARLAETLNELISLNIDAFANILAAAAPAIGAVFDVISGFLDDVPASTVQVVAGALVTLGLAFGALNTVIAASSVLTFFKTFTVSAGKMGPAAGMAATGIGKMAKAAGLLGAAAIATGLLASAFKNLTGAADSVAPSVEEILQALSQGGGIDSAFTSAGASADSFAEAIAKVASPDIANGLARFNATLGGLVGIKTPVDDAAEGIAALDATLAQMVSSGDSSKAAANFAALTVQAEKVGVPVEELTKQFPAYAEALAGADNASRDVEEGFEGIAREAGITLRSIEDLADAISGFGDTQLTANEATRNYATSVMDLNAAVAENGAAWGTATKEGIANMEAIDGVAEAALRNAEAIKTNTGSQELANAAIKTGRDELIKQLAQFGIVGTAAEEYADSVGLAADGNGELTEKQRTAHADLVNQLEQFGLTGAEAEIYAGKLEAVPGDVDTNIALLGTAAAIKGAEGVKAAIDNVKSKTVTLSVQTSYSGNPMYSTGPGGRLFEASGDIFNRRTDVTVGEAGPEAIVPLRRPLNQVDPSVRALSAIAQGLPIPGGLGGSIQSTESRPSRTLTISPGAIVIQGDRAPETTATNVVNRIAQRLF